MFGLPFIQGSAIRTWNCVAHFANILWYKFNHLRGPNMPRSRRRHHSRSRSRSRSHSHDREREPKRRKIDNYESPHHRRSVSSEPEVIVNENQNRATDMIVETSEFVDDSKQNETKNVNEKLCDNSATIIDVDEYEVESTDISPTKSKGNNLLITPKKVMSPKQLQKKLESEKKRLEKQKEKDEREKKRQLEKEEKLKQKQEKEKEKQKEKEIREERKKREKEEKEQKRREKEEKEEYKRKEKEQDKLKRQQEIEEKNKEKQKIEEQKQKAAAAFANFFVTKKTDDDKKAVESVSSTFMPFEVKSDMRLAPVCRTEFSDCNKKNLDQLLQEQSCTDSYLDKLKGRKLIGKSGKTWPYQDDSDDIMIVEENSLGETIEEQKPKLEKMRAKFFKFHENQRPPYFGTWRKKSKIIRPKKPFTQDSSVFNYDVDSDDEWEEESEGESLKGTDDEEEKENEPEEYEVDNEFFVPHGHLSDDEVDDEADAKMCPETHKAKLKLLKKEFDEEMQSKTEKLKPRVIGCVWYDETKSKVEDAIDKYLQPFSMICNGPITVKKRSEIITAVPGRKVSKQLSKEHVPIFLKFIHGSTRKRKILVKEFLEVLSDRGIQAEVSMYGLGKQFKQFAQWVKCPEEGPMHNKLCWYVSKDIRKDFNVNISLPNKWKRASVNSDLTEVNV